VIITAMGKHDYCVAFGCNHYRERGATCSFFSFPSEPEYRQLWVAAVKRQTADGKLWQPRTGYGDKLCGCHFTHDQLPNPRKRCQGRKMVVPSIFVHKTPVTPRTTERCRNRGPLEVKQMNNDVEMSVDDDNGAAPTTQDAVDHHGPVVPPTCIPQDHDYIKTGIDTKSRDTFQSLRESDPEFLEYIATLEEKAAVFEKLVEKQFSLENVRQDDSLFQHYTGLQVSVFTALYRYLSRKAQSLQYFNGERTLLSEHHGLKQKPGRPRKLTTEEEMFATLYRLKTGHSVKECAIRFEISPASFSKIFSTWITFLAMELEALCKNAEADDPSKPVACFDKFANLRVILDCTELFSETPTSIASHKQLHSSYKHHSTSKFLVGITPVGTISYVSSMYGGRASDKFITQDSTDLLDSLLPGQQVMVDRGFTIEEDLPVGVRLIIPAFKGAHRSQLTKSEVLRSRDIAKARVHVERAMRKIKIFGLLRQEMRISQLDVFEQVFKTAAYLVNFQKPFLKVADV
jgi:hypothetical protein